MSAAAPQAAQQAARDAAADRRLPINGHWAGSRARKATELTRAGEPVYDDELERTWDAYNDLDAKAANAAFERAVRASDPNDAIEDSRQIAVAANHHLDLITVRDIRAGRDIHRKRRASYTDLGPAPDTYSERHFTAVDRADKAWVRAAAIAHAAAVRASDAATKARRLAEVAAHVHDGGRAYNGARWEESVQPAEWACVVHAHSASNSAARAVEDTAAAHVATVRAVARHEHAHELFAWDNDEDVSP